MSKLLFMLLLSSTSLARLEVTRCHRDSGGEAAAWHTAMAGRPVPCLGGAQAFWLPLLSHIVA